MATIAKVKLTLLPSKPLPCKDQVNNLLTTSGGSSIGALAHVNPQFKNINKCMHIFNINM